MKKDTYPVLLTMSALVLMLGVGTYTYHTQSVQKTEQALVETTPVQEKSGVVVTTDTQKVATPSTAQVKTPPSRQSQAS